MHDKQNNRRKRQLQHRINLTSSSSNPNEYRSRMTDDDAETANPEQIQASKHMHGTGHDSSPIWPG